MKEVEKETDKKRKKKMDLMDLDSDTVPAAEHSENSGKIEDKRKENFSVDKFIFESVPPSFQKTPQNL